MTIHFDKYQGAGNDFIMVDQRFHARLSKTDREKIAFLCDRRFGIGADGLIILHNHPDFAFEMVYFNADGRESTMCGNGGRCIVAFAKHLDIIQDTCRFLAIDGPHEAALLEPLGINGFQVSLQMINVPSIEPAGPDYILFTGSPHYVRFVDDTRTLDMRAEGRAIRYSDPFREDGINVNIVSADEHGLQIRTYERGVEDETLACGTGVTAAALAWHRQFGKGAGRYNIPVTATGGRLSVRFEADPDNGYSDIWLNGPAERVFTGEINIP